MASYKPTKGMITEAQRGLDWRREHGRGGTEVGIARARDIVNGKNLSESTVKRMYSFFSRHEVDKQAEGFSQGEDGYPSNGRIAWALWSGDEGYSWSRQITERLKKEDERNFDARPYPNEHAARLKDPSQYDSFARDNDALGDGIDAIYGIKEGISELQAIRFDAERYTPEQAREWLDEHDFEPLEFEEAIEEKEDSMSSDVDKHPVENTEEKPMEKDDRHILSVSETNDSIVIEFEKHNEDVENEDISENVEVGNSYQDEEDRDFNGDVVYRTVDLSRASHIDEKNRRVRIGVSSEEPVERSFGMEILSHQEGDIGMDFIASGRAPLLLDHDMTKQIGVIEEFKLDPKARRTIAVVRFGRNGLADEVFNDVVDGIRQNISVGYKIDRMERQRSSDKDQAEYRVAFTPLEVSIVSVPADQSKAVGVGRSKEKTKTNITFEEKKMTEEVKNEINLDEVRAKSVEEARAEFKRSSKEILDIAAKHNRRDLAHKAIQEGLSVEQFRGVLLDNIANDKPLETAEIGMTPKEVRNFSLVRAIRALANPSDRKAQQAAAFEFECSEAAQRESGNVAKGIMLPADVLRNWKRDLNTSDDSTLVSEDYRAGDFIDVLRNSSSVMQAGATLLRGLSGNIVIPKKTASSSAGWIATEGGAASESEFTSGSVTMSPKVIGAFTDASRLMLQQSSLDIENLIRDDLTQSIAIAIDLGALAGSGSSGQPTGIKNTSGVNTTTFAAANPTFAEIVGMESAVSNDNALFGNLAYICRPADYGTLKTTAKDTGSGLFVVEPDGRMNGYNTIVSNQVTSGDFYFGNFSDLLIGMYGGLDIQVDPYALSTSGGVRIIALQTVDVAVRHAVSFCVSNDGA
jgi:HK97 family phage major capsid protein